MRRLASPEHVDRLMTVVGPRLWLVLLTLLALSAAAVTWSIWASVPETVEGSGILLHPGSVRSLQATARGRVVDVKVEPGTQVAKGDVLVVLAQDELRQQLDQARQQLVQLRAFDTDQKRLEGRQLEQELAMNFKQEDALKQTITRLRELADKALAESLELNRTQRERLTGSLTETEKLTESLATVVTDLERLADQGLATAQQANQARSASLEAELQLTNLQSQLAEIDVKEVEARQFDVQQRNRIAELELELQQLGLTLTRLEQQLNQSATRRALEIQQLEDKIAQVERELQETEVIRAPLAGRVLELTLRQGQVVPIGQRIGALDTTSAETSIMPLTLVAYFPLGEGKRLAEGQPALITPANVERERFGSIRATVERVSPFATTQEAAAENVGNAELVQQFAELGGVLEVRLKLDSNDAGQYAWTGKAPPMDMTAGTSAKARVIVERRAPISYLVPFLRRLVLGPEPRP